MRHNFEECIARLLEHEGGYVWHAEDPGGETNYGVTRAVYEQYVGRQVMDGEMDRLRADDLPSGVDWSCFDWGVNSGTSRAAKALQRIVGVEQDGGIGPMTLQAVAEMEPAEIVEQMHHMRDGFYRSLTTFETFGRGWIRRNDETKEQALNLIG